MTSFHGAGQRLLSACAGGALAITLSFMAFPAAAESGASSGACRGPMTSERAADLRNGGFFFRTVRSVSETCPQNLPMLMARDFERVSSTGSLARGFGGHRDDGNERERDVRAPVTQPGPTRAPSPGGLPYERDDEDDQPNAPVGSGPVSGGGQPAEEQPGGCSGNGCGNTANPGQGQGPGNDNGLGNGENDGCSGAGCGDSSNPGQGQGQNPGQGQGPGHDNGLGNGEGGDCRGAGCSDSSNPAHGSNANNGGGRPARG